jgi:hypothetical protein
MQVVGDGLIGNAASIPRTEGKFSQSAADTMKQTLNVVFCPFMSAI